MASLRMSEELWSRVRRHLLDDGPEHFAFLYARWDQTPRGPVFVVRDALLVPEEELGFSRGGYELSTEVLLEAVNTAVRSGEALIECHSHGVGRPRFSGTDRQGLAEVVPYV